MTSDSPSPHRPSLREWLVGALSSLLFTTPALSHEAAESPFLNTSSPEMRTATIGYRLATASATSCARTEPVTGLLLHDLSAYPLSVRSAVSARYRMAEGFGILGIVPGSPADEGGLKAGDEIVALNEVPIAKLGLPPVAIEPSYARIEAFVAILTNALTVGPVVVKVRNLLDIRKVNLTGRTACAAPVAVVPGDRPEAWSDAHYAAVTQGLARLARDDELAFAVAHEMAHVLLQHAGEPHGPLTTIGIGGRRSRERERAADRLGTILMVRAGYDANGAEAFLQRMAASHPLGISMTHPSVRARIESIRVTAQEMKSEQTVRD